MRPGAARLAARAADLAVPLALAAFGWSRPDDVLWGGLAWLGAVLIALAGWGALVERAVKASVDLGLRLAWGVVALLAVAGALLAARVLTQPVLLALLAVGYGGYAWRRLTAAEPVAVELVRGARALADDPQRSIAWGLLAALAAINVLLAVARTYGNPFDDDVAYLPLIQRLLDVGDLDEPFSFRRLSALGGQTVLGGLTAARGTLLNLYAIDHGAGQLITWALLIGLVRGQPRREPAIVALVALVVVLLPDASTNTASHWTGAALFLALYRTAVALPNLGPRGPIVLGATAAAIATLRQNFLPVAVLMPALVLGARLERPLGPAWRRERAAWAGAVLGGLVVLTPYLLASWQSNRTLLYPLVLGTGNPNLATTPAAWSVWQELQFFLRVALDPNPIRVMVPLLPVLLLVRDRRPGAPLRALAIASAVGFALLVHNFSLSDARNLWRYAFGFMTPLALVLALEVTLAGWDRDDQPDDAVAASRPARWLVVICLLAQFVYTSRTTLTNYRALDAHLARAAAGGASGDVAVARLYGRLQAAVPAGAPLVAMLDDAAHLDYARNRVINLDTPGFASYRPGLPMFVGAEAKAAYFRGHGLRYLAFVRGDHSRYFYRRDYWLERIFWDVELWRIVAGYQLDMIDSFAELASRYPIRFEEDGLVVVDLGASR